MLLFAFAIKLGDRLLLNIQNGCQVAGASEQAIREPWPLRDFHENEPRGQKMSVSLGFYFVKPNIKTKKKSE